MIIGGTGHQWLCIQLMLPSDCVEKKTEALLICCAGVFGTYSQADDPWVLYDLSIESPVRDYLYYFYNQTAIYAAQTGVRAQHFVLVHLSGASESSNMPREMFGQPENENGMACSWVSHRTSCC